MASTITMDPDFFIDVICLAIHSSEEAHVNIVNKFMELCEKKMGNDGLFDDPFVRLCMQILEEIKLGNFEKDNVGDRTLYIGKFADIEVCKKYPEKYSHLKNIFIATDISGKHIQHLAKRVSNTLVYSRCEEKVRGMFRKLKACDVELNFSKQDNLLTDVMTYADDIKNAYTSFGSSVDTTIEVIDMTDKVSIQKGLDVHKTRKVENVFKLGLQGLGKMFGKNRGPALGELICFYALVHNFKSSLLIKFARWIVSLNTPKCKGIPTLLFISLENEASENLMVWFYEAYLDIKKEPPKDQTDEEVINVVTSYYNRMGWKLLVYRKLGEFFGYEEYVTLYNELKNSGHSILASIIDYMALMKLSGSNKDSNGFDNKNHTLLQLLFNRMRNFNMHEGTTLITAHQLNNEAAQLVQSGQTTVVKKFGSSMIADAKGIEREMDFSAYVHIEKNHLGEPYLTFQRGKHRTGVDNTPEEDRFTAYRFTGVGILDDHEGECQEVKDIFATENLESDEIELALM